MIARPLILGALALSLQGCVTFKPEQSNYVQLTDALKIVARDLDEASPVVLSDTDEGASALTDAIKTRQCTIHKADPALPVITGPVSLQLQGQIQGQGQGGVGIGQASFQVQVTKLQQQQLTIPITFVPATALSDFFLGQSVPNVSGVPAPNNAPLINTLLQKAKTVGRTAQNAITAYEQADHAHALPNYCASVTSSGQSLSVISVDVPIVIPVGTPP